MNNNIFTIDSYANAGGYYLHPIYNEYKKNYFGFWDELIGCKQTYESGKLWYYRIIKFITPDMFEKIREFLCDNYYVGKAGTIRLYKDNFIVCQEGKKKIIEYNKIV